MNLVSNEIRANLKSSIVWTACIAAAFLLLMLGAFPTYISSEQEVGALLANYPPEFMAAFGINIENLFSFGGFYNFAFGYLALMAGIMASALSIGVFAREKHSKCLDFLLTKPITRPHIFMGKLLSCVSVLLMANIVYLAVTAAVYRAGENAAGDFGTYLFAMSGLFFTQLVFLSIGIAVATFSKRIRSVAGTATALGFGAFVLSAIANIFSEQNIAFMAPLKYFEPQTVFENGGYALKLASVAILLSAACVVISFVKFCKSDAHAVYGVHL